MVPIPGGLLTYHVRVADRGPQSARSVHVEVRLPAAVSPVSVPARCTVAVEFIHAFDSGVCHNAFFRDPDGNAFLLHHRYAPKGRDA